MSDSKVRVTRRTVERSEKEEKQFLHGKVRSLTKQLKQAKREVSRLRKYIRTGNIDVLDNDDLEPISQRKKSELKCDTPECTSTNGEIIEIIDASGKMRKIFICKECGKRTRIKEDGFVMETEREPIPDTN